MNGDRMAAEGVVITMSFGDEFWSEETVWIWFDVRKAGAHDWSKVGKKVPEKITVFSIL